MSTLSICLISAVVSVLCLLLGFAIGVDAGKKKRKAPKKLGGYEFSSITYEQTTEPEVTKGHEVLVEMDTDSNITKQRISIDGISTGIDSKTFVTTNLRDTVAAHLNMKYGKIASDPVRKRLEAIGLIKADVSQVVLEGVLYRITFVKEIK